MRTMLSRCCLFMQLLMTVLFKSSPTNSQTSPNTKTTLPMCGIDQCSDPSQRKNINGDSFLMHNCFCDEKCSIYGDCCQDTAQNVSINNSISSSNYTCQKLYGFTHHLPIYMYSTCVPSWDDLDILEFCQKVGSEILDPIMHIPVYSIKSATTYKNIFCAVCNYEESRNLVSWKINLKCYFPTGYKLPQNSSIANEYSYNSTDGKMYYTDIINTTVQTTPCDIFVSPPNVSEINLRHCKILWNTCAENWTNTDISFKCKINTEYRYYNLSNDSYITFKNKYCAQCNYIKDSDLLCIDYRVNKPNAYSNQFNYTKFFMLDTDYDNATKGFCPLGTILDPFKDNCRKVVCLLKKTSQCNNKHTCTSFSSQQYQILSNGSVFIPSQNTSYEKTDYHFFNGNITVCRLIHQNFYAVKSNSSIIKSKLIQNKSINEEDDFCIKIALQIWEIEFLADRTFYVKMLNKTFRHGEYELDDSKRPIICDKVHIFYSKNGNDSCWKITLRPWAYKYQNNSLFVDILNKSYAPGEYSIDANQIPQVCISLNLLSNVNSTCVKMIVPKSQSEFTGDLLYIRKFNRTYSKDQYKRDATSGNVSVCISSTTMPCSRIEIQENDFEFRINNSIYVYSLRQIYTASEYELSNDKALVCIPEGFIYSQDRFSNAEGYVTIAGLSFSILCLVLHLIVFFLTPDMRNLPGKNLASFVVCLILAQSLWMLRQSSKQNEKFCIAVAISVHFLFLSSFTWMGVISYDVWCTFVRHQLQNNSHNLEKPRYLRYSIFAWGVSFIIVLTAAVLNFVFPITEFHPLYTINCWIDQRKSLLIFFAAPLAVILLLNLIFFLLTTCSILKTSKKAKKSNKQETHKVLIYCRLAIIMGLAWIFGFVTNPPEFHYVHIIMNSLQGVFVFLSFTCNRKTRDGLRETFARLSVHRTISTTTMSTRVDSFYDSHGKTAVSCSLSVDGRIGPKVSLNPKISSPI